LVESIYASTHYKQLKMRTKILLSSNLRGGVATSYTRTPRLTGKSTRQRGHIIETHKSKFHLLLVDANLICMYLRMVVCKRKKERERERVRERVKERERERERERESERERERERER
jgi:hypothetical protein